MPRRSPRRKNRCSLQSLAESSSSSSDDDDDFTHSQPSSHQNHALDDTSSSEDDDGDVDSTPRRKNRPLRRSRRRTSTGKRLSMAQKRKKSPLYDSDEEYVDRSSSSGGSEDNEDPQEEFVENSDDEVVDLTHSRRQSVQNVDSDGIGSAESSSEDEGNDRKKAYRSPTLILQKPRPLYESDSSVVDEYFPDVSPKSPCMSCPSTNDAITDEDLEGMVHVCFHSPDGSSRQCFLISTLRRVAMSRPCYRQDTLTGKHMQAFLQPPHFRSIMSDDLMDQIASRFGRDALNLNGEYYRRTQITDFQPQTNEGAEDSTFSDQLLRYMQSNMGSKDLYVCPLCYTVAHARMPRITTRPPKDAPIKERYPLEFRSDPMAVLGSMDRDEFKVASLCSSTKVHKVRQHLREDHDVDTSVLKGTDLYARFKIRTTDGLLQRYTRLMSGKHHVRQGQLQRYWFDGNNELFVLILSQLVSAEECREILAKSDHPQHEEAHAYWLPGLTFFESFADDTKELWDLISAPYHRYEEEDMTDFIGAEEEEEDVSDGQVAHRALAMEEERERFEQQRDILLSRYRDRDDNHSSEGESSEDDVVFAGQKGELPEASSSSEDDEWTKRIKNRKRSSLSSSSARSTPKLRRLRKKGPTRRMSRLKKVRESDSSDDDLLTPSTKRNLIKSRSNSSGSSDDF